MKGKRIQTLLLCGALSLAACQRVPSSADLLSNDPPVRDKAFQKLTRLKDQQKSPLVEPMIQGLHDPDPQINQRALDALAVIGSPAVPALTASLKDSDAYVRMCAVEALGRIGSPSIPAVPDLIAALKDQHPLVQEETVIALQKIGTPEALAALPPLPSSKSKKPRV